MNCAKCADYQPHGLPANSCRECRWTGCQLIAEKATEKWPCPLELELTNADLRETAAVVLGIADSRGLLGELLGHYSREEAGRLEAHLLMARLTFEAMAVTDGREEGAGITA